MCSTPKTAGTKDSVDLEEGDLEQEGGGCGVRIAPGRGRATCMGFDERANDGTTPGNMHAEGSRTEPDWCMQGHEMSRLRRCMLACGVPRPGRYMQAR
jgi:hypothetical protein